MSKTFSVLAFCTTLLLSLTLSSGAMAVDLAGAPCPGQFGTTKMNATSDALIACLKTTQTNAALVWKSMTPTIPAPSGGAMTRSGVNGIAVTAAESYKALTVDISSKFTHADGSHTGSAAFQIFVNGAYVGAITNSVSVTKTGAKGHYWGYQNYGVGGTTIVRNISAGSTITVVMVGGAYHISSDILVSLTQ